MTISDKEAKFPTGYFAPEFEVGMRTQIPQTQMQTSYRAETTQIPQTQMQTSYRAETTQIPQTQMQTYYQAETHAHAGRQTQTQQPKPGYLMEDSPSLDEPDKRGGCGWCIRSCPDICACASGCCAVMCCFCM